MPRRRAVSRRIALALPHGVPFIERLLVGVAQHARGAGWTFLRMPERMDPSLDWLQGWSGEGVIAAIASPRDARLAQRLSMPVVSVLSHLLDLTIPQVTVDHAAIGRLAADHLLARRFQTFGFYGVSGRRYSDLRRDSFVAAVTQAGGTCHRYEGSADSALAWAAHRRRLTTWLQRLPKPVGVFACTDERAVELMDVCEHLGIAVPRDLAVIGVDNDPVLCEFARVPLTSIARDDVGVGIEAARMLETLMRGKAATSVNVCIPPTGIVERCSTATVVVHNSHLAAVLARIDARIHEPFNVAELVADAPLARRRIEELFRRELGCSPYAYVLRARVARARRLLDRGDQPTLTVIAKACGFTDLRHFRQTFRRMTGQAPVLRHASHGHTTQISP